MVHDNGLYLLDLGGGIKAIGEHVVRIELHSEVTAEIKVHVVSEQ